MADCTTCHAPLDEMDELYIKQTLRELQDVGVEITDDKLNVCVLCAKLMCGEWEVN